MLKSFNIIDKLSKSQTLNLVLFYPTFTLGLPKELWNTSKGFVFSPFNKERCSHPQGGSK
jgi:hypothetical protein